MFGRKDRKDVSRRERYAAEEQSSLDVTAYRRGTTLNTFHSDEPSKTERTRLKRLRAIRRRLAAALALVIVVVVLGISLLTQFTNSISGVAAGKNIQLSQSDIASYTKIVDDYFANNSFERFSFARRNSVLQQYLEQKAPEVAAFRLVTSGLTTARLELTLRRPVAMWIENGKVSYVDSNGVVFAKNYFDTPSVAIEDNSGVQMSGGVATSAKFLSFVGKTVVAIEKNQGLKVVRVVIPRGSARYVEIYLEGRNYPFKAQITRDAFSQASDIAVMTRYIDGHSIQPQYVDCRIEGKAYWK